ncbi:thymidine kinase [Ranunculus cassubicifolius]
MRRLPLGLRYVHYSSKHFGCNNLSRLDDKLKQLCLTGRITEALEILCHTDSQLHSQTYSLLLQECIFRKEFNQGKRIHVQMLTTGFPPDQYLQTKLLILYSKLGDLQTARNLFDEIPHPKCLVSWNAMISGYVQNGREDVGLDFYKRMRSSGITADQFTFASVFRACALLSTLEQGKQAHGVMIKTHLRENVVVSCALMDMYFKCSSPFDGHQVFDDAVERNVVTWTSLISGYGQNGQVEKVLEFFHKMILEGFKPNYVTFLAVLSACSHAGLVSEGQRYFSSMTQEYGIRPRLKHYAAMVDLLGRAGRLNEAYEFVLSSPCEKHSVVWGALLGACRVHGDLTLLNIAAKKFFELEPENTGKYIVLSNTYAAYGLWKDVKVVREALKDSGLKKEPACSWIEIRKMVHNFLVGDKTHKQTADIYETIKQLTCTLKDADYVPDVD